MAGEEAIGQPPHPYDLTYKERCELASQVLIEGEPASLREWALVYAGGCEEYEGGEALAHVLRENRYAQTQNGELDLLVNHGVFIMRDRALFEAALELVTDPAAGERARVEAMRILYGQLHPGVLKDYEAVVDPEVPYTASVQIVSGGGREGEPLPPNASKLVATALRAVAEDPSAPPAVRAAAEKIGRPYPYDLPHEERCEIASRALIEGEPVSLREWALVYAGGCKDYDGGEALAHVLRENRYAQTQNLELDLVLHYGIFVRDRALFEAALEVATDPAAGERARVEAMRILYGQLHPGGLGDYEAVVDPDVPYIRSMNLYSDAGREGEPLPPNASELVATALRAVAEDPTAPPAVRAAAQKIGR